MPRGKANQRIITDRLDWVAEMVSDIQALPLDSHESFVQDKRNIGAAESCLRRALEALLDLGRHLLAKVYGVSVTEYKKIANELENKNVLHQEPARKLRILAGYRNRMVHFYHEITTGELYQICANELDDLMLVRTAFLEWVKRNPELVDTTI